MSVQLCRVTQNQNGRMTWTSEHGRQLAGPRSLSFLQKLKIYSISLEGYLWPGICMIRLNFVFKIQSSSISKWNASKGDDKAYSCWQNRTSETSEDLSIINLEDRQSVSYPLRHLLTGGRGDGWRILSFQGFDRDHLRLSALNVWVLFNDSSEVWCVLAIEILFSEGIFYGVHIACFVFVSVLALISQHF